MQEDLFAEVDDVELVLSPVDHAGQSTARVVLRQRSLRFIAAADADDLAQESRAVAS